MIKMYYISCVDGIIPNFEARKYEKTEKIK